MTKKEFMVLVSALKTYYPRENVLPTKESLALWYDALSDLDIETATAALKLHVQRDKFPPAVSDIRMCAVEIVEAVKGENLTWAEAWSDVCDRVAKYGVYREKEALDEMDERTKAAIRVVGWRNLCMSEDLYVERANFRMAFEALAEKKKTEKLIELAIPDGLVQKLAEKFKLKALEGGIENE